MFDAGSWPDWLHALRLVGAFVVTVAFGIHAYLQHKEESMGGVSPSKWMYWLYAAAFLAASVANFAKLAVTAAFHNYQRSTYHLGYSTLLLILSYVALLAGVRRRSIT